MLGFLLLPVLANSQNIFERKGNSPDSSRPVIGRLFGGDKRLSRGLAQHESGGGTSSAHAAHFASLQAVAGSPEEAALTHKQALYQD